MFSLYIVNLFFSYVEMYVNIRLTNLIRTREVQNGINQNVLNNLLIMHRLKDVQCLALID